MVARRAQPCQGMALTGLDQLWVADITYVISPEFAYLAIVLDAFSRKVIGRVCAHLRGTSIGARHRNHRHQDHRRGR